MYIAVLVAVLLIPSTLPRTALGEGAAPPLVAAEAAKSKQERAAETSPSTEPKVPHARTAPRRSDLDKYQLRRLQELNRISEFMSQELEKLREASRRLASHEADAEDDQSAKVSIRVDLPSLDGLDANGEVVVVRTINCSRCSRPDLAKTQKQLESHMEELRHEKDMITGAYERRDSASDQLDSD